VKRRKISICVCRAAERNVDRVQLIDNAQRYKEDNKPPRHSSKEKEREENESTSL